MPDHPLSTLRRIDPEFMEELSKLEGFVYEDGALPRKVKLLIALAFDAAHGAEEGVRALSRSAMEQGATKQEIAEVLRVAYHLAGVGSLYTAASGMRDMG